MTYEQYRVAVLEAIRANLFTRWPPSTVGERRQLEANIRFFETECSYEDEFQRGDDPRDVAEDEIDAAASGS